MSMLASSLRFARLGMIALCVPLLGAQNAAPAISPEQARIGQEAVAAYIAKTQAEQKATYDRQMRLRARDLYSDPGTAVLGNPNGDVTIVEFFDYNCPFSRRVEPRVQALLKSDPNVRLILKEFTIEPVASSPAAGRAALAAQKQGKYEAFHNSMLAVSGRFMTTDDIFAHAQNAGLDVELLKKDMEAPEIYNQIIDNFNLARALRIFQTPTFIIDGQIVTQPSAEIDFPKLVAAARANKQAVPPQ